MRCTKCGYVSFDYLSECKKCRTSLADAREGLGFFAAKPAVPSLLESLLSDYEHPIKQESAPVESEISTAFDGFGGGLWQTNPGSGAAQATTAIAKPDESEEEEEEDFSLLDLSDQELELLIDKGPLESPEQEIVIGSSSNDAVLSTMEFFAQAEQKPPAFETSPVETPLKTETAHGPDSAAQTASTGELIPKFIGDLPGLKREVTESDPEQFVAPPEQAGPVPEPDGSTDDFVIELSENDLDSLMKEMNGTTKGKAEQD
ncbi:MAG: hypothetical protein ACLQDI_08135 [Syntrophobacteraceae bacterium]